MTSPPDVRTGSAPLPAPVGDATRRAPAPARLRSVLRWIHLVVGSLLATYVYLPADLADPWLRWPLALVGIPAVTVTGLWMWKQAAVRRYLARRRSPR